MSDRPLLTLTLICKNEAKNVARLLDSAAPFVDEIVVVDTGSTDGTLAEFKRYAAKHKFPRRKLRIAEFTWADDFAAARQAADNLATGEWLIWADMDDEIRGLETLREFAAKANQDVVAFFARYSYAQDPTQNTISELWRERVVRNDGTQWTGRLHEHKLFTHGAIVKVAPEQAEWIHHRDHANRTSERNLRVLNSWLEEEPDNPRIVQSIAMELMGEEGKHLEAADWFSRYLALPGEPPDRRAQATRSMCQMLLIGGRAQEARAAALQALQEMWLWPDTHLTLAECDQTLGRPDQAIVHAQTAMSIGKPDTLLIVNPLQYTAHPRAIIAVCLMQMGRLEEAQAANDEALQIAPSYPLAVQTQPQLRGLMRKHLAVGSMVALCDSLIETGEPLKARRLLDCAPWYVEDDERIIRRRGDVAALIQERSSAPKVTAVDDEADAIVSRLRDTRERSGVANL